MREIEHGTSYGYDARGCRCELCRAWMREKARMYRQKKKGTRPQFAFLNLMRDYGDEYTQFVPADIAIEVVRRLKDEYGVPFTEISTRAKCNYVTIHNLYHGRTRNNSGKVRWETSARIYGAEGWFEAEREAAHDGA